MSAAPVPFESIAKSDVWFAARKRHIDGTLIQSGNTTVAVKVVGDGDIGTTLDSTPVGTVYNTLQTGDARWPDDCNENSSEKGFNFEYTAPASAFPSAGYYRVEFTFTQTGGAKTKLVFEGPARSTSE